MAKYNNAGLNKVAKGAAMRAETPTRVHVAQTPTSQPIPGRTEDMHKNRSGGYVFTLSTLRALRRYMILGTDATYVSNQGEQQEENSALILEALKTDGAGLIRLIEELNMVTKDELTGADIPAAAPKKAPSLFALAVAKVHGDPQVRQLVHQVIARRHVISTGRQLFEFLNYVYVINSSATGELNGKIPFGAGFKRAVRQWMNMGDKSLVYQFTKYRAGTYKLGQKTVESHYGNGRKDKNTAVEHHIDMTDVLRLGHIKPQTDVEKVLFEWVARAKSKGHQEQHTWLSRHSLYKPGVNESLDYLAAFEHVQLTNNPNTVLSLISKYGLTWEMIPNAWFSAVSPEGRKNVWRTLIGLPVDKHVPIAKMGLMALVRNLPRLSAYGVLNDSDARSFIKQTLAGEHALKALVKARIHPIQLLQALRIYKKGETDREGGLKWNPQHEIAEALESAFYLSFGAVQPTHKKIFYALDISGSMSFGDVAGLNMTPLEAEAVMAMVLIRQESNYIIRGFTDTSKLQEVKISKHGTLEQAKKVMESLRMGGTDASRPIAEALDNKEFVDVFVIMTDSETWNGRHAAQVLKDYRQKINPNARIAAIAMMASRGSINDPSDHLAMDFVGFDATLPHVLNQFILGLI